VARWGRLVPAEQVGLFLASCSTNIESVFFKSLIEMEKKTTDRASTVWGFITKAVKAVSEKNCEKS
jgi:hypothetical protein